MYSLWLSGLSFGWCEFSTEIVKLKGQLKLLCKSATMIMHTIDGYSVLFLDLILL